MSDRDVREKAASLCHTQWSGWMKYLFSLSVQNTDGTVTIPKGLVERWQRQITTPYSKLGAEEKKSDRKEADRFIKLLLKEKTAKPKPDPRVRELILAFQRYCQEIKGFKPEISWGVEGKLVKKRLADYSPEDLKDCFDWFLNDELSERLGCTLKIALNNYTFNKWLSNRHRYA